MRKIEELLSENVKVTRGVLAANAADVDRERSLPKENLRVLGERGLLGLLVPEKYGPGCLGEAHSSKALQPVQMGGRGGGAWRL
jgi:alkylation response protein AidB-like acyl-CoA dehydrogenase